MPSLLPKSKDKILKRLLLEHIRPYIAQVSIAIFFMVIVAACSASIVRLVKPAVDEIFLTHNRDMLIILPLIMVGIHSVKGIAEYFQNYLIKSIGQKILTRLQMQMYNHLLHADLALIQSQSSGRLISRFTNDISLMRGAVSNLLIGCAKHFLSVVFLIILMFKLEPVLSLIVFIFFPIAILPIQKLGRKMRSVTNKAQEELSNFTSRLDETFQSIRVVKSFGGESIETNRANIIAQNILKFYKRTAKFDALISPIMEILSGLSIGLLIWYGGTLVFEGKTTPGALFAFLTAFVSAYRPFKSLLSLNVNLQEGLAAAARIFAILDTHPTVKNSDNAKEIIFDHPEIIFDKICLKFEQKTALKSINLKLPDGKSTALVGRSGGGKTSLGNLLVRFYDPSNGVISINGHDIKTITLESLRSQIALVSQDTILFDADVSQNIAYGKQNYSKEQIIEAAKAADAHEFILNLPQGYNTVLGTQGFSLSGGQRQRLSIARAFLKDAPILILDEATSSLDLNSEQNILNALKKLRQGKTTLIITHRLSSIIDVDNIVVLKSGEIIEQGSHQQLIQNKGEYFKLYNREIKDKV